jgi:hypothetical protein
MSIYLRLIKWIKIITNILFKYLQTWNDCSQWLYTNNSNIYTININIYISLLVTYFNKEDELILYI